jgi:3-dehydrosphinganine reductase
MLKLILAGVLALPCFLVILVTAPIIAILAIPSLYLLIYRQQEQPPSEDNASSSTSSSSSTSTTKNDELPDHVIVVGGSSGIGKSIAHECVRRGVPKLTILARNPDKLKATKEELLTKLKLKLKEDYGTLSSSPSTTTTTTTTTGTPTTEVSTHSVSVSDYAALQKLAPEIIGKSSNKNTKNTTNTKKIVLFNCAGIPYTTEFEKVPVEKYESLVQTNQLGAMYVVRAFLPHMDRGTIVLCSSAAAQVGVYGYTVYSPTKYALRGFAETLHAELLRSKPGVAIQLAFPADTDTPGYEQEVTMMPEITRKLNESAGLADPNE